MSERFPRKIKRLAKHTEMMRHLEQSGYNMYMNKF